MYQLWQQRQQTIAVTRVPRGQCQRVIITTANYPHQQGQIPPQQISTVNTVSSAFEPPPSYDDAARNYPKYNDGSQFPSHPPGYGAPQAGVPVAGQTSGFTNNAFR
ncbi:Oidioi.mRNA.OKI2018_I69.chr2.g5605.t1.cds [Oikopleura dioica]|uniref:Oidioi.mRNA.OKI2018_I69.chr2.g5605.t1.cds n=1 Tax=Oikopleura dioica TaxID=34765 RepID=A0ABN7T4F3_OIKDI|nr:Oidioi.mRNA.OKI2018_I69.chr2.g5605.t1.cds [Oikopleura dioica]